MTNLQPFADAALGQIDATMQASWQAWHAYSQSSWKERAALLHAIASKLEQSGDALLQLAMQETHLPEARLRGERARTIFQMRNYADALVKGHAHPVRIDLADTTKTPPKPDIRKMPVSLGPVVVFGASNFPFAYSTAGGDTASALAAGCPVVVKAHPAHAHTSEAVAALIYEAVAETGWPAALFQHVHGAAPAVGQALVMHPCTQAVGFTGSYAGGMALWGYANQRPQPIPVFAEMGSINPVFLLPEKMSVDAASVAEQYAASITLGVGQFCTNPGLLLGVDGPGLDAFKVHLQQALAKVSAATMLHEGIAAAYDKHSADALSQPGVELLGTGAGVAERGQGLPILATTSAAHFLQNKQLHREVFGPYALLVVAKHANELIDVAQVLEGQLTATIMASESELSDHGALVQAVMRLCGRIIYNGVPTGVEVCTAMHHGGPFPATTDSRYSSVGADAIGRFMRPQSFQNWPHHLLPLPLQNDNPLGLVRLVDGVLTKDAIA